MKLLEASFLTFSVGACVLLGGFFALHHTLDIATNSETIDTLARDARVLLFGSFVLALLSNIVWLVWLYRSWKLVHDVLHPDEDAPSPFRVVALSLVPLFNIFWQLVSVVGLCSRMNASLERAHAKHRAPTILAVFYCLLGSWGWMLVPSPGVFLVMTVPLLGFFVMRKTDLARAEILSVRVSMLESANETSRRAHRRHHVTPHDQAREESR